jgi:hypothetical protein
LPNLLNLPQDARSLSYRANLIQWCFFPYIFSQLAKRLLMNRLNNLGTVTGTDPVEKATQIPNNSLQTTIRFKLLNAKENHHEIL